MQALNAKWLLISYTLPAEPSSKRVLVWRHLRKLGAVLDAGVWLLPYTPAMEKAARDAVDEVKELGGRAISFVADDLPAGQNEALQASFNSVRREEYIELLQRCQRFQDHVQRLIDSGDFKFGAVEEMEEDLEKRRRSFAQISERDVFAIDERRQTEASIKDCEAALARFVELAFLAG
jgi:hypothetical protein